MPTTVTVRISTRVVSVSPTDLADFEQIIGASVPSECTVTQVEHDAHGLPEREQKEFASFCSFARKPAFQSTIRRLTGFEPGPVFQVEVMSASRGEDPPDMILRTAGTGLGIEVTDFPPDRTIVTEAIARVRGPGRLPTFLEGGCDPARIQQIVESRPSMVRPPFSDLAEEVTALWWCVDDLLAQKDSRRRSQLLLLDGPHAFEYPEAEVVEFAVRSSTFAAIQCVVFNLAATARVFWTNKAPGT
jgi:hypothetical protein